MSTQFTNRQWRLPNNENKDKQSNYSMDFDGSSRIDCGNDIQIFTDSHSYSFWVKKPTISESYIFGYGIDSVIIFYGDGRIRFYTGGLTSGTDFYSTTYLSTNIWYHICCTYEKNGDKKIYIDGSLDNTISTSGTIQTGGVGLTIGARNLGGSISHYFTGQLDGICLFNYALTDGTGGTVNQIAALYGSSSTGIGNPMSLSPAPVAYYPLGDQDAFNGADYLVPNSSLKDYVFDFNNSQEINCGNDSSLQMDTVFTMSCWINTTSTSRGSIMGTFITNGYYIDLMASGTVQGGYHSTGSHFLRPSSSTVNDGNWHHICYVISGTATDGSDLDVYVDGQLDNGSFTSSGTPSGAVTTNPFKINLQGYSGRYTGKTSNVQVFNTELPATGSNSVETLYNNGSPLTSMSGFTSLQGWWKLDASATYDGSDWTIPDDSSNSNDGTSSGMTQANLVQSDLSFTSGYSPYGLRFDGTNEKIEYTNGTIDLGLSSTETWWIKYSNSSATSSTIASAPVFAGFHILYEKSTNKIYYRIDSTNLYYEWLIPSTYFTDNLWHHYAIVRDDSLAFSSYIKLYIDGNLFGSPTAVNATTKSTTNTKITDWGGASAYSGIVADFSNIAVWNISLSSTEVQEIFNSGVPSNLNNFSGTKPYSWWQLGSNMSYNSNWTILDEGTGNNNGDAFNISEDSIVDGVGSYANGLSSGMGGDEIIGSAPFSDSNSLSVNMDALDRTDDTPN